jgi:hypothetical protein
MQPAHDAATLPCLSAQQQQQQQRWQRAAEALFAAIIMSQSNSRQKDP